ncbi:hypothetical protein HaLaN_11020, partial [Haematococcus lacustris]
MQVEEKLERLRQLRVQEQELVHEAQRVCYNVQRCPEAEVAANLCDQAVMCDPLRQQLSHSARDGFNGSSSVA